jgi:hypothetical protein
MQPYQTTKLYRLLENHQSSPIIPKCDLTFLHSMLAKVTHLIGPNKELTISDLTWFSKEEYTMTIDYSPDDAINYGIPFFDFMIAEMIIEQGLIEKINFKKTEKFSKIEYSLEKFGFGLHMAFFLALIRDDMKIANNSLIPKFCIDVYKINDKDIYEGLTTVNNLDNYMDNWFMELNWTCISKITLNRLAIGIAGFRLMKIFVLYKADKPMERSIQDIYLLVKEQANKGIFLEYHPRVNPRKEMNLSRNLQSLMTLCYTDKSINEMLKNRHLVNKPIYDVKYTSFTNWDRESFSSYVTTIEMKVNEDMIKGATSIRRNGTIERFE